MTHSSKFSEENVMEFIEFLTKRCAFTPEQATDQALMVESVRTALYGDSIVHFKYVKKSTNEVREAYGTLNKSIWHDKLGEPLPKEDTTLAAGNIRYYDTESGGWRQFTIARLIGFVE